MTINQLRRRARRRAYLRGQPMVTVSMTFGILPTVWNVAPPRDYASATDEEARAAIEAARVVDEGEE